MNPKLIMKQVRLFYDWQLFDIFYGTDTALSVSKDKILKNNTFNDFNHMNNYVGSLTSRVKYMIKTLRKIDSLINSYSFIDLGSGKGKVLILAEKLGFLKVIGVEISPELNKICRSNLAKVKSKNVEIIECDATKIILPDGGLVFYIYNSFRKPMLEKVLKNIENSFDSKNSVGYVIHMDPKCSLDNLKYTLIHEDNYYLNPFHIYKINY